MECKFCGAELEEGSTLCASCGAEQTQEPAEAVTPEETPTLAEEAEAAAPETEETAEAAETAEAEEAAEAEAPEADQETAPVPAKRKLWLKITAIVCCVSLALALALGVWYGVNGGLAPRKNDISFRDSYTVEDEKLLKDAQKVVATAGEAELTNAQLQIFYWMEVYNFLDEYSSYLSYFGLDLTKPLSEQYVTEDGQNFQQYFLENALNSWHSYQSLELASRKAGHQLSQDLDSQLELMAESMETSAAYYQFESADDLIRADMGAAADLEVYMDYMELYFRAMDYFESIYLTVNPTAQEIEAYFAENADAISQSYGVTKDSGKLVDVRHILILPQGGTTDESGQTTYSEEEWETCRKTAEALLEQWKQGEATEETFSQLANEKSEDPGSNTNGGLYTFVYEGQMVEPFEDWCFDESRQTGDTGLVRTSYGYHIMYYVVGDEGWIRCTQQELINEACTQVMTQAKQDYPLEVNFKAIRIADVDLAG